MRLDSLRDLKPGEGGRVAQIDGGYGLVDRLASLGIRPGQRIRKLSTSFMRGPVTVEVNRTRVAVGFGIAARIILEVEDNTR